MEFIIGGLLVVLNAVIANKTTKKDSSNLAPGPMIRQYKYMVYFGLLMASIGLVGLLSGKYTLTLGGKEVMTLVVLLAMVNLQARIGLYGESKSQSEKNISSEKTNIFELISIAKSLGIFPKGNAFCLIIAVTQIAIVGLVLAYFFSKAWQ